MWTNSITFPVTVIVLESATVSITSMLDKLQSDLLSVFLVRLFVKL